MKAVRGEAAQRQGKDGGTPEKSSRRPMRWS
jgi:hypothetical protein